MSLIFQILSLRAMCRWWGSDVKVLVKILRDTGAFNSFIVSSVLAFSQSTDTGDCILMRGMGLNVLPVPVHKLELDCGLVQGEVAMGTRPALPIRGVDVILGNDLAGSRVWADGPAPSCGKVFTLCY